MKYYTTLITAILLGVVIPSIAISSVHPDNMDSYNAVLNHAINLQGHQEAKEIEQRGGVVVLKGSEQSSVEKEKKQHKKIRKQTE